MGDSSGGGVKCRGRSVGIGRGSLSSQSLTVDSRRAALSPKRVSLAEGFSEPAIRFSTQHHSLCSFPPSPSSF